MRFTKEEKSLVWLDSFGLEYARKAAFMKISENIAETVSGFADFREKIASAVGEEDCAKLEAARTPEYLSDLFSRYSARGILPVTWYSDLYPEALKEIDNPPFVLYCKGNAELLKERKFSVVGSRRTLPHILKETESFSEALSEYFVIVTGLADGGDTAAATGALESGRIISVLAFGFDHVYPECNRGLLEKIEEKGLAVTEYIPSVAPKKHLFPERNRIIAGLSEGLLVVSGDKKSGTRITADFAYNFGRDVFAFPYSIGTASGEGCNHIIKEYAKLTDNLVDITSAFGINLTEKEEISLTSAERAVLEALAEGERHISEIAAKTGLKPYELPPLLTLLEMKKLASPCGGNRWSALKR